MGVDWGDGAPGAGAVSGHYGSWSVHPGVIKKGGFSWWDWQKRGVHWEGVCFWDLVWVFYGIGGFCCRGLGDALI